MAEHYNIAVLGSGPGGYVAALKAGQMGARAVVIEKSPHVGGTCLNNGCIPSKAILATAELLHRIEHSRDMGVAVDGAARVDWPAVQKRKDKILQTLRSGIRSLWKARNVEHVQGKGVLDGRGRLVVLDEAGQKTHELTADNIIVATGSQPALIPGWPSDAERICTTDEALHWTTLPKRLLIVGGGVIGCEFACMMQPMGVEVTIVEMMPRLLPPIDADIAKALAKIFQKRGIAIHTNAKVEDLALSGDGVTATLAGGQTIHADRVLVSIGRRPATDGIGLDTASLTTDRGFLRVDDRMQTPVKGIYCIGDANGQCLLAHAASAHGLVAVENALDHPRRFADPVPNAVYTFPEISSVGLTADEAREKGLPISVGQFPLSALGKAMAAGETDGLVKVVRHRGTDEVLGVHMMGHNVTECIAAAVGMMHVKAPCRDVAHAVMAHPTIAESLKEAAEDALAMGLHLPPRRIQRIAATT